MSNALNFSSLLPSICSALTYLKAAQKEQPCNNNNSNINEATVTMFKGSKTFQTADLLFNRTGICVTLLTLGGG